MTDVTVKQFAMVVGIPVDRLLEQFTEVGIAVGSGRMLRSRKNRSWICLTAQSYGNPPAPGAAEPRKIILKRKTHSEIKMTGGGGGQVKTVSIEVRKVN